MDVLEAAIRITANVALLGLLGLILGFVAAAWAILAVSTYHAIKKGSR